MLAGTFLILASVLIINAKTHSQSMKETATYRVRLRFRVQKKLAISSPEYTVTVDGREAVLSSALPNIAMSDSEWLVFNSRGFGNEAEARIFGHKLRTALAVSSVATRLGIDAGRDIATSGLGSAFRQHLQNQTGHLLRDNVHGLDVFIDDPRVRIFTATGTGTVRANPLPLLSDIDNYFGATAKVSKQTEDVISLLNVSLMQANPVAQIVFAFSAVEMLGQQMKWTESQRELIAAIADYAARSEMCTDRERVEVVDAIRNLHRLSLRQGVLRLLDELALSDLRKSWDQLYAERSKLVHGLAPEPGKDYGDLAHRAMNLCGRILLAVVALEVPAVSKHVDTYYQRPLGDESLSMRLR